MMKTPIRQACGQPRHNGDIASCIAHGWAEPWTRNPIKPEWLVCRLTLEGYQVLGHAAPPRAAPPPNDAG
jgi:hypothetical protein